MLLESRAWSVAAFLAVLTGLLANPVVSTVARHLYQSPGYPDGLPLVMIDPDTVHFGAGGIPEWLVGYWRGRIGSLHALYSVENWRPGNGAHGERIPPGMLEDIGARPWKGRTPRPGETQSVLVSYEWARGDANLLNKEVYFGYEKYRVVGIMPPGFRLITADADVWALLPRFSPARLQMAALLGEGRTLAEAQRELRASARAMKFFHVQKLELMTFRQNRIRNLLFAADMLKWNLAFVLFICTGGLARFLLQRKRSVTLRQHMHFLAYLLGRILLLLAGFGMVWVVFMDRGVQRILADGSTFTLPAFSWSFLLASWGATFWCLRDQQHRCRVCFDRLRMPVHSGRWSSLVLDRPRTEYICRFGHGTLYVPGTRLLDLDAINWTSNEDMWRELFEHPVQT